MNADPLLRSTVNCFPGYPSCYEQDIGGRFDVGKGAVCVHGVGSPRTALTRLCGEQTSDFGLGIGLQPTPMKVILINLLLVPANSNFQIFPA